MTLSDAGTDAGFSGVALSGVAGASTAAVAGALVGVDAALLGVNDALMFHLVWLDPGVEFGWNSVLGMTQLIAGTQNG